MVGHDAPRWRHSGRRVFTGRLVKQAARRDTIRVLPADCNLLMAGALLRAPDCREEAARRRESRFAEMFGAIMRVMKTT
jgi:hypothetical protein